MEVVFSRFTISGTDFYFYSKWGEDNFQMSIIDGKRVWIGEGIFYLCFSPQIVASREYIESKLKPKGMDPREYLAITKEAFTVQDLTKQRFSYSLVHGTFFFFV